MATDLLDDVNALLGESKPDPLLDDIDTLLNTAEPAPAPFIEVEVEGFGIVEFPAGTPHEEMQRALDEHFGLQPNETTLEYKQRRAIARGDDPNKETATRSASGRDRAIIVDRLTHVLPAERQPTPEAIRETARQVFEDGAVVLPDGSKVEPSHFDRMRAAEGLAKLPEMDADDPKMLAANTVSEVMRSNPATRSTWLTVMGATAVRAAKKIADGDTSMKNYTAVAAFLEEERKLSVQYGKMSVARQFVEGVAQSLEFVAGIYSGAPGKQFAQKLATKHIKKGMRKKVAGVLAGEVGRLGASPILQEMAAEGLVQRMAPQDMGPEGLSPGDPFIEAFPKAVGSQLISQLTERAGRALYKLPGMRRLKTVLAKAVGKTPGSIRTRAEWNGIIAEYGEERLEDLAQGIFSGVTGDGFDFGTTGDVLSGDPERMKSGLRAMAIEGLVIGTVGGPGTVADVARKRARAKQLKPMADKWTKGGSATEAVTGRKAVIEDVIPIEGVLGWAVQDKNTEAVNELLNTDSPSREQWRKAGLRPANVDVRQQFARDLRQLKETQDASQVPEDQGVPEETGEVGRRGEADRGGDVQQVPPAGTEARDTEVPRVEPEVAPAREVQVEEAVKQPWEMTREEFKKDVLLSGSPHPTIKSTYATDLPEMAASFAEQMQAIGAPSPGKKGEGVVRAYPRKGARYSVQNEFTLPEGAEPMGEISPEDARSDPHHAFVQQAVAEGKPVPPGVLAEYPDLAPTTPQEAPQEQRPAEPTQAVPTQPEAVQEPETAPEPMPDYSGMTLKELRAEAKTRGLKRYSGKKKTALRAMLEEAERQAVAREKVRQGGKALKGKKGQFQISRESGKETVEGTVYGVIGVNKADKGTWVLTHKPSGLALGPPVSTLTEARELAWLAQKNLNLSPTSPTDKTLKELKKRVRWYHGEADAIPETLIEGPVAVPEGAERGVSGEASKPTERPEVEPKTATARGEVLQPVQMPELFQLAKDLMEGKVPRVKNLRGRAAGRFKGKEGIGPLAILIDPSTAADEQALAQTLAHEVGHLIDFVPENTLRRGNLLGRLQSLRDFLETTMPPVNAKDQSRLRREARKDAGKDATKEEVETVYQQILKDRGLLANSVIRQELVDLTKWWSGDYAGGKTSYTKYRESGRELYAEALSVFLNSPGDLEAKAPEFYQALLDNLNAKPDVLAAYSTLQQMLNGTGQELAESRTQTLRDMFGRAEEHINNLRMAQEQQRKSVWSGIMDVLGQYLLTSAQPVLTRLGRKPIKHAESPDAEAARFALDELFTINAPNHTFLRNIDEEVYLPLIEAMQARGLNRENAEAEANFTLGEYLFHWRVANERDAIANPAGFSAAPATSQLETIKTRIGDDAYAKLEEYAQRFHDLVYTVAEEAANEGVYNRKTFNNVITPNKDNYSAFRVTHYIDEPDIIATGVIQQVGTFSDIQNPFQATVLKVVRLNRLIELNRAKNRVRRFLENNFSDDIKPVEMVFAGVGQPRIPKKQPGRGKEHVVELVDGHPAYFEVPTEIAKSFSVHDIGGLGQIAAVINSGTYKIFHPFFVTYNPRFVVGNPFRDLRRAWINLGATDDIPLGKLLYEWGKALPVAVRRQKGIEDAVLRDMLDNHALDIPYTDVAAEGIDTQIDQLFQKYGLGKKGKPRLQKIPVIGKVLELIEHAGAVTETATKVAGWRVLEEKGVPVQERSYRVRKYVGTPDYKQRGLATALSNSAMMYSRIRWNGLQADIGLATNPDTAAGWWWRQVVNVIMPTSFAKFAAYGGLGWALRAMFGVTDDDDEDESVPGKVASWTDEAGKRIAKYFLTDYDVIPLGVNRDGKAVFITIPRDDLGKFIARVWWHALDLVQLGAGQELRQGEGVRDVLGNLFTDVKEELIPSFSPPIEIASKWLQYGAGINPVDSFYNQQIVPRKEWAAGGWHADSKMVAWTLDEFGAPGAVIHYPLSPLLGESFEIGTSGGTVAVMKTAGAMTGLKRLLRISNSGLTSDQWARLENADQEAAAFRLSLPNSAQEASTRRYFLMRREALGEVFSRKEQNEMHRLNLFYNAAYLPLRKMIQEAEDAGRDSKGYRQDMERAGDDPLALLDNPPESIAKSVASYKQGLVYSGTKPPPDPDNYEGRPETFREAMKKFKQSLPTREDRLRLLIPTLNKAQQLLIDYYNDKYPKEKGGIWEKGKVNQKLKPKYKERRDILLPRIYAK